MAAEVNLNDGQNAIDWDRGLIGYSAVSASRRFQILPYGKRSSVVRSASNASTVVKLK
jgi:hypothetical protein